MAASALEAVLVAVASVGVRFGTDCLVVASVVVRFGMGYVVMALGLVAAAFLQAFLVAADLGAAFVVAFALVGFAVAVSPAPSFAPLQVAFDHQNPADLVAAYLVAVGVGTVG